MAWKPLNFILILVDVYVHKYCMDDIYSMVNKNELYPANFNSLSLKKSFYYYL